MVYNSAEFCQKFSNTSLAFNVDKKVYAKYYIRKRLEVHTRSDYK